MKVSILIPAHDSAAFIGYAINSALSQTHKDIEIIVVDDGSQDNTSDVVNGLRERDSRISLIRNAYPLGPAGARNVALSHATGVWIAPLDSDDEFAPDRLEKLLHIAETRGLDALADGLELIDFESRTRLGPAFDPAWLREENPISLSYLLERDWPGKTLFCAFGTMKPIIRKAFLDRHKIQYAEEFRLAEDLLFYCDLLISGARFGLTQESLYKYYIRKGSISNGPQITTQMVDVNYQIQLKLEGAMGTGKDFGDDLKLIKGREVALWFQLFTWAIKVGNIKIGLLAFYKMPATFLIKSLLHKIQKLARIPFGAR
jgi:succinoglycan biosynthesis protein ExoO